MHTIDVNFPTKNNVTVSGKFFLPSEASVNVPLVVLMHGCAGIFSYSDPSKGLALQFREWSKRLTDAGYAALLIDSFSGRGVAQNQCENGANSNTGVSEVTERPYDAYAGVEYLRKNYKTKINFDKVVLIGWSHGGSSTLSAMSTVISDELNSKVFKHAFSFYPGCGLYGAFGGITTSTYAAYAPTDILAAGIDPLYTVGYCDCRVERSDQLGSDNLNMIVYSNAQHSFDLARQVDDRWTQADVDAKKLSNQHVMSKLQVLFK
jgi:dienelactone hydrolase